MPGSDDMAGRVYRFPRATRLKRRRLIRPLFDRDRDDVGTVAVGCVRLLYRTVARAETGYDTPVQVGFAPGRFRGAIARNRVRRLLREGYRVRQHVLVAIEQGANQTSALEPGRAGKPVHAPGHVIPIRIPKSKIRNR